MFKVINSSTAHYNSQKVVLQSQQAQNNPQKLITSNYNYQVQYIIYLSLKFINIRDGLLREDPKLTKRRLGYFPFEVPHFLDTN